MPNMIYIDDLSVTLGHKPVLRSITCGVPKGQVVGLIGPSGSGKTTLMRTIIGAQKATDGEVVVMDRPAGDPKLRSLIGYMAQSISVYSDLTVAENLGYFARLHGLPKGEVDRVIDAVELMPQRRQLVRTLSGGQQARVSLAVALLGTPPLLVLDEPTVGLDPLLRQTLWDMFRKLAAAGTTLLISSHIMDEAVRCNDLLLLRDGQLIAQGSVASLLQKTGAKNLEDAFIALAQKQNKEAVHA